MGAPQRTRQNQRSASSQGAGTETPPWVPPKSPTATPHKPPCPPGHARCWRPLGRRLRRFGGLVTAKGRTPHRQHLSPTHTSQGARATAQGGVGALPRPASPPRPQPAHAVVRASRARPQRTSRVETAPPEGAGEPSQMAECTPNIGLDAHADVFSPLQWPRKMHPKLGNPVPQHTVHFPGRFRCRMMFMCSHLPIFRRPGMIARSSYSGRQDYGSNCRRRRECRPQRE